MVDRVQDASQVVLDVFYIWFVQSSPLDIYLVLQSTRLTTDEEYILYLSAVPGRKHALTRMDETKMFTLLSGQATVVINLGG